MTAAGQLPFDAEEGRRRRDEGVAVVADHSAAWQAAARRAIDTLCWRKPDGFTADDLVKLIGLPPGSANAVGAAFIGASRAGLIVRLGEVRSARAGRHAGRQSLWGRP